MADVDDKKDAQEKPADTGTDKGDTKDWAGEGQPPPTGGGPGGGGAGGGGGD